MLLVGTEGRQPAKICDTYFEKFSSRSSERREPRERTGELRLALKMEVM